MNTRRDLELANEDWARSKTDKAWASATPHLTDITARKPGGEWAATATENDVVERDNDLGFSPMVDAASRRHPIPQVSRIVGEAKARGKATGYADADTVLGDSSDAEFRSYGRNGFPVDG